MLSRLAIAGFGMVVLGLVRLQVVEHEKYLAEIDSFCTARAIPYFRAPTTTPFDELVLQIFRRGGLLR